MLFSSLEFLLLYLPITLAVYFVCPLKWRNGVLLAVSLVFYGWGEPVYLFLMIATVLIDYAFGLAVGAVWCYPYSVGANPFLTGAIV